MLSSPLRSCRPDCNQSPGTQHKPQHNATPTVTEQAEQAEQALPWMSVRTNTAKSGFSGHQAGFSLRECSRAFVSIRTRPSIDTISPAWDNTANLPTGSGPALTSPPGAFGPFPLLHSPRMGTRLTDHQPTAEATKGTATRCDGKSESSGEGARPCNPPSQRQPPSGTAMG
jgi:hypothetical protein